MNSRGYSGRYSPRRRRRGVSPLIIIISVTLVILFTLFIVLGNALNKKTQEPPDENERGK